MNEDSKTRAMLTAVSLVIAVAILVPVATWAEFSGGTLVLVLLCVLVCAIANGVFVMRTVNRSREGFPYWQQTRMSGRTAGTLTFAAMLAVTLLCLYLVPPRSWPTTVDEAADIVIERLDQQTQRIIAYGEADPLYMHFGLGMWIRNELGLWGGNHWLLSDCGAWHPDDCSEVILSAVVHRLRSSLPEGDRLQLERLEAQIEQIQMAPFNFQDTPLKDVARLINAAVANQLPAANRFFVRVVPEDAEEVVSWTDPVPSPFAEALIKLRANTHVNVRKEGADLVLSIDR